MRQEGEIYSNTDDIKASELGVRASKELRDKFDKVFDRKGTILW